MNRMLLKRLQNQMEEMDPRVAQVSFHSDSLLYLDE